jgi:hypothetical protein
VVFQYGILRVLIENDGTEAIDGTFDGRPEGSDVVLDGVTYWITYQYNAEAGQFDTGNDVALVSSLFSVSPGPESQVPVGTTSEHVRDATHECDKSGSQFQLHTSVSSHDPNWPVGEPQFTFTDEDPTVATLDENGAVTFYQTGVCRIRVVSPATEYTPEQTFELPLAGTETESWKYIPDTFVASNNLVVLYNADSPDSVNLMAYYSDPNYGRPGVANATYLPISAEILLNAGYTDIGVTSIPDNEPDNDAPGANPDPLRISAAGQNLCVDIAHYVANWIEQNKPATRYVVGLAGLPSRAGINWDDAAYGGVSVPYMIYQDALTLTGGPGYGGSDRFSAAECGAPLVAWLDCGSYAATHAYIDKEIAAAAAPGALQADGITISGSAAGIGGNTWALDDAHHDWPTDTYQDYFIGPDSAADYYDVLLDDHVNGTIAISPDDHDIHYPNTQPALTSVSNPTAYASWGVHSGLLSTTWPYNGQVTFTGNAGWWIGTSCESFNGIYGDDMGDPTKVFAATAFGGTNYGNTPICFVGSTEEPGEGGCVGAAYFDRWAKGWSTLEAAWAGRGTAYFLVATDVCLEP